MNKKTIIYTTFFLFLLLFLSASYAEAATYYVRADSNDSCNGTVDVSGSSGNCAKKTIQAGVDLALTAGDTVIVHAGTYNSATPIFTSKANGSSGSLITIRAATGETVSITRAAITHNYNKMQGFRATSPGAYNAAAILLSGNYNTATENTVVSNCTAMISCTAFGISGSYNIVSYNTVDGQNNGASTTFNVGLHISGNYNEILYNTIKDANSIERVFELYGRGNHIAYNEVKNSQRTDYVAHPDIFQVFGTGNSYDHIIENNYFHDFVGQVGNLTSTGGTKQNWIFRNNIFANIKMEFFIHIPVKFYNNTFYRVTTTNTGFPLNGSYTGASIEAKNNAFIASGTGTNNGWYTGNVPVKDYNFVSHTATGGTKSYFNEVHGVNGGNPQLIAHYDNCTLNTCDFHVGATSALINVGIAMSEFSTDKDGINRPQDSSWDIGAYEYLASVPPSASSYEAESCILASPMQTISDPSASGGQYIQTSLSESGTATCSFSITTPGTYTLIAKVFAPNSGTDSFYFQMDNSPEDIWDLNPTASPSEYSVWREDSLAKRGTGTFDNPQYDPYALSLSSGNHTFALRGREANTRLDYFYLAKVTDITPPSAPIGLAVQ